MMTYAYRPYTCTAINQVDGKCVKIKNGKECGKEFKGPNRRKYCDECSETVRYRGRA